MIERTEEDRKQFKSKLNEITTENPKYRLKDQLDTIKILKIFKTQEKKKKIKLHIMIMLKLYLKLCINKPWGRTKDINS